MDYRQNGTKTLTVFDVEYFGTKDGPGIRTVIFLKGCPLNCLWCQNPESQKKSPEIFYYRNSCILCGQCMMRCPQSAIRLDEQLGVVTDESKCLLCGICTDSCIYNARKIVGKSYTLEELKVVILKDFEFFKASGGGVTFSGGEPHVQYGILKELLSWTRRRGIHTAVETSGFFSLEFMKEYADSFDLIFIDLKHIDDVKHKDFTGVSNEGILKNIEYLLKEHAEKTVIRIPVIPDFNFSKAECGNILDYLRNSGCTSKIEVLPYHNLGETKYAALSRPYELINTKSLQKSELLYWSDMGRERNLNVVIGAS